MDGPPPNPASRAQPLARTTCTRSLRSGRRRTPASSLRKGRSARAPMREPDGSSLGARRRRSNGLVSLAADIRTVLDATGRMVEAHASEARVQQGSTATGARLSVSAIVQGRSIRRQHSSAPLPRNVRDEVLGTGGAGSHRAVDEHRRRRRPPTATAMCLAIRRTTLRATWDPLLTRARRSPSGASPYRPAASWRTIGRTRSATGTRRVFRDFVTLSATPSGSASCTTRIGSGTSTKSRTRMARSSDHRSRHTNVGGPQSRGEPRGQGGHVQLGVGGRLRRGRE